MTPRARTIAFGSAAALVVAGGICALVIDGLTGQIVALALATLGLGAVVLLVFYEVGLSEDRELAKEEESRRKLEAKRDGDEPPRPRLRRPRRPL